MSAGWPDNRLAIWRDSESARSRKHGITEATDISLTVPLSATEKGTPSNQKPSMTVDAARPQSWGVARLSFGMPKNVGRTAIAPEKPRSTPKWRNPLPMVADCEMPN